MNNIIDPITKDSHPIYSAKGKALLKSYIKYYNKLGGTMVYYDENMLKNMVTFGHASCAANAMNWIGIPKWIVRKMRISSLINELKLKGQPEYKDLGLKRYDGFANTDTILMFLQAAEDYIRNFDKTRIIKDTGRRVTAFPIYIKKKGDTHEDLKSAIDKLYTYIPNGTARLIIINRDVNAGHIVVGLKDVNGVPYVIELQGHDLISDVCELTPTGLEQVIEYFNNLTEGDILKLIVSGLTLGPAKEQFTKGERFGVGGEFIGKNLLRKEAMSKIKCGHLPDTQKQTCMAKLNNWWYETEAYEPSADYEKRDISILKKLKKIKQDRLKDFDTRGISWYQQIMSKYSQLPSQLPSQIPSQISKQLHATEQTKQTEQSHATEQTKQSHATEQTKQSTFGGKTKRTLPRHKRDTPF